MGLKSPSRRMQTSQTQDHGGPHGHVPPPLACRQDVEALQLSGGRSDPHVSKPAFDLVSELARPSTQMPI